MLPVWLAKLPKFPHPLSQRDVSERVHVDVCQVEHEILSNKKYFAVLVHEPTDYTFVRTLESKDEAGDFTKEIIHLIEKQTENNVKFLKSDNGGEYVNRSVGGYFKDKGIKHDVTIPYTREQNGLAERINHKIQEIASIMSAGANLPSRFWAEAVYTANNVRNITMRASKGIERYIQFRYKKPNHAK